MALDRGKFLLTSIFFLILFSSNSFAEEEPPSGDTPAAPAAEAAVAVESIKSVTAKPKKPKRRWRRRYNAQGTKAQNRFRGDPVIKSNYRYKGRPLVVDPD